MTQDEMRGPTVARTVAWATSRQCAQGVSALAHKHFSSSQSPAQPPPAIPRVAVLYQALDPPIINGTSKPKKPGGYRDSGADIAYALSQTQTVKVVCESDTVNPANELGWSFPDTEEGILKALNKGATHLWANTILFASHPLQTSARIGEFQDRVKVVGQPPLLVEQYDDKDYVNTRLRAAEGLHLPEAWHFSSTPSKEELSTLSYPVIAKPARGRGSYGVKVCHDQAALESHLQKLSSENLTAMIEEYLAGEEATVTVMPPGEGHLNYWSLPVVTRFNHEDGIAPYNGVVAVTQNSRVVTDAEVKKDPAYEQIMRECEDTARLLGTAAPIRIDVRRYQDSPDSKFALFDVNMKPNMTGPGRPGREDQASLTLIAAQGLGWDYAELLRQILKTSTNLKALRETNVS